MPTSPPWRLSRDVQRLRSAGTFISPKRYLFRLGEPRMSAIMSAFSLDISKWPK